MDELPPGDLSSSAASAQETPFAQQLVTLTKQEHIQLVCEARQYKELHQRAVERLERQEREHREEIQALREAAALREQALHQELEKALARARDLELRHFAKKSGRGEVIDKRYRRAQPQPHRKRGQQPGAPGHGRTTLDHLTEREEPLLVLASPCCPKCGEPLEVFPGTDECEVVEIEVRAYRRRFRRQRYRRVCRCEGTPRIVAAPPPPRLIPRGKWGISVWVDMLLDKFEYVRPSFRGLAHLKDLGVSLSPGTLCGGFQQIAPLFVPLYQACLPQLRNDKQWNADETRWEVFVELEGKTGHRWYLWVFCSRTVVYYVLDPSRSAEVIETVLGVVDSGVIICDRYSAYKKFARLHPAIVLAFCWSHQRRDLLKLANEYPHLESWALDWVDRIGEIFRLYDLRCEAAPEGEEYLALQGRLRSALRTMARERQRALADPKLAAPARKVLESMKRHWQGLREFVRHKSVPPDNNTAERAIRPAAVGRKNFYGSASRWSGELAAMMFTLMMTVKCWGINPRTWLSDYLHACATSGNRVPADLKPFLPWSMDAERLARMRSLPCDNGHPLATVDTS
jgi:transposase